jgi:alpha-galactosidase
MKRQILLVALVIPLAASLATAAAAQAVDAEKTVKVFILAGQSNMEGKAANTLLDHQATDPKTKDFFAHLRDGDKWAVRDDVFIKFLGRKGPLTIGYAFARKRVPARYEYAEERLMIG